jgi:hypothetical protein
MTGLTNQLGSIIKKRKRIKFGGFYASQKEEKIGFSRNLLKI